MAKSILGRIEALEAALAVNNKYVVRVPDEATLQAHVERIRAAKGARSAESTGKVPESADPVSKVLASDEPAPEPSPELHGLPYWSEERLKLNSYNRTRDAAADYEKQKEDLLQDYRDQDIQPTEPDFT